MKVPKRFREYGGESNDIDWGSVGMAVVMLAMLLFAGGIGLFGFNYFATTTFTGPCAGAGGIGKYAVDYVQCANGKRVIYERATVDSNRYGLHITNGGH